MISNEYLQQKKKSLVWVHGKRALFDLPPLTLTCSLEVEEATRWPQQPKECLKCPPAQR